MTTRKIHKDFAKWLFLVHGLTCEHFKKHTKQYGFGDAEDYFENNWKEITTEYSEVLRSKVTLDEYRSLVKEWKKSIKDEINRLTLIIIDVDSEGLY